MNLVKRDFHSFHTETDNRDIRTIKRCNQYIAVYTKHSLSLDMVNYLAPGYSYANYSKAFIAVECKGFFPYEWMTSTRKLSNVRLPPRSAFYSSLTGTGISQEQYNSCLLVWMKLGMIGQHKFFCLEQAFQFLRAKILEKPLAATRIFLSRDEYYIKQVGRELGTSDKWEARKFDLMYECLKKKFDQQPDLKALLLKTGDLDSWRRHRITCGAVEQLCLRMS